MSDKIEKQLSEVIQSLHWMHERLDGVEKRVQKLDGATAKSEVSAPVEAEVTHAEPVEEKPKKSFEETVGMRWLPAVGVIALVFGVAFFLKYAFDSNWIGETGRVVMGILGGVVLLGVGDFLKKKYTVYAQILSGGGVALLYLSIYASYAWYDMIPAIGALAVMGLVTLMAGLESIRIREPSLALLGIVGGFLTPALLSSGDPNINVLFPYILLLNLGVLGISFFQKWRHLNVVALLGTLLMIAFSVGDFDGTKVAYVAYATAFFLTFVAATVSHNIIRKKTSDVFDSVLIIVNSMVYFGAVATLYWENDMGLAFFAFALAAFYFLVGVFSHHHNPKDKLLSLFLPALAVVFMTTSFGLMFDQQWVTIAWAIEALLFIWLSFELGVYSYRIMGLIVMALTAWRLLLLESGRVDLETFTVILNSRFVVFVVSVLAMGAAGWLYAKHKPDTSKAEHALLGVMIIAANFFAVFGMTLEVQTYYDIQRSELNQTLSAERAVTRSVDPVSGTEFATLNKQDRSGLTEIRNKKRFATSVLWVLYAALLVIIGFIRKSRLLRTAGILFFFVTILKIFLVDLWALGQLYRILSSIGLGVVLLSTFFLYHKFKDRL